MTQVELTDGTIGWVQRVASLPAVPNENIPPKL